MTDQPRRYSVSEDDPEGYRNLAMGRWHHRGAIPVVYLDGEPVRYAVVADEVEGVVVEVVTPLHVVDGKPATITRRGSVEVRWEPAK